jgi:hypothetical protein
MRGLTKRQPIVVSTSSMLPRGSERSGLSATNGDRLIDWTPPASAACASPVLIARAAWLTASRPEAHSRLTVTAGTSTGSPASNEATRATLRLSSPAAFVHPRKTSSTSSPGRPE